MTKYAGRDLVLSIVAPSLAVTSVFSTGLYTTPTHGYVAGDAVVFNGLTGGAGLVAGKRYYVIAAGLTTTVFAVSATSGGATFATTSNITAGSVAKFNPVGQVTAVGGAGSSRAIIDASAYGDAWKDYVVGQQDGDDVSVEVAYDPISVGHIAVKAAYDAGTSTTFSMRHSGAGFDVSFPALVTKFDRGADLGGLLKLSASLKILNPGVIDTP